MLWLQAAGAEENHPDVDNINDLSDDDQQQVPNVQKSSSKGNELSNLPLTRVKCELFSELELPCSHPGNIDHGLTDWNGTGHVAKFACYQGYYLVGPPKLICR